MVIVVAEHDVDTAIDTLQAAGETAWEIGCIVTGAGEVTYV